MNTQSFLYEEITREKLEICCRRYLNEELCHALLLSGGLFNTTYLLETASGKAVLRLGPVNRHLLLPYEHNLMAAEAEVQELFHKHHIPTSRLIACDNTKEVLDRDIMVVEYIESQSAVTADLSSEQKAQICRETGRLTRKIHEITPAELRSGCAKTFGRYALVLSGQGCVSWKEAILEELNHWLTKAKETELFTESVRERLVNCFQRFAELFNAVEEPHLVHGDLWFGNILVDADGKLAAIIDSDRAVFGDPEWEFATGWMTGEDFCAGYGSEPDSSPDGKLRRRLYKLLMNLEDCYIHRSEYNNPNACEELSQKVLEELNALEAI